MLRVGDCMLSGERVPIALPGDSIMGCLGELTSKSCGCVLVTGPQQQLLGTFTDGDLRRTLQAQGPAIFNLKVMQYSRAGQLSRQVAALCFGCIVNSLNQVLGLVAVCD